MAEVKLECISGKQDISGPKDQKIWIVYKQWPTGKIERVVAYFSESLARAHAGSLVGKDNALIGLETIDVNDARP